MAASAFYIKCCYGIVEDPAAVVKLCTGYDLTQLSICIEWLSIFKDIPLIMDSPLPQLIHKIHPTDQHNIQLHNRSVLEYMVNSLA
jgi:hypothetical protein